MKHFSLLARSLFIGLCLSAIHIITYAQGQTANNSSTGNLEKLIRFAQGTSLRADGDTGETEDPGFIFHKETGELELTADFLIDQIVPFNNPAIKRIYGNHTFFRADDYDGTILEIGAGVEQTFEIDIDGRKVPSNRPEIVVQEGGVFRMNGTTISNITHFKAIMGIVENAGTMYMANGSFGEYNSIMIAFDNILYCLSNAGTLILQGGTISNTISNSGNGKIIIDQNATVPGQFGLIHCYSNPLEIASPIYTNLSLSKTIPLVANSGFRNGEVVAQGTSSYQITEEDRKKLSFPNTNIVTELVDNQIRIKSGGVGNSTITLSLQAQIDAATGTAENPTVITIPEAGLKLSEQITIKDKHIKITGGTITADFSKTEWLTMFRLESGTLIFEDITLDGNRAQTVTTPATRTCTFINQLGGTCYLNNNAKLTNAAGHHDWLNNVLIEGGTCYLNKGAYIIDNRCLMGGCVRVTEDAHFIVNGGYIIANDEATDAYWAGAVYVEGRMDFYSGDISHHQTSSIGIVGKVYYGSATTNEYCFTESIRMYKGGTLYLTRSIGNVNVTLDKKVEMGDVLIQGTSGYQLTESDRAKFQMPEGYSLKLEGNTLVLVKEGEEGVSTLDELIAAINAAPTGTNIATQINVNGTIYVDRMITVKGKHIYLTGKDLVFINTATTHIRFFSVENGGELHIANAVLDGNKDKTGKYCSFAYVSANSELILQGVTMKNAWSDSKTWTMLRIEGKCYIYTGNVNNTRKFSSIINNSGTGLVYIGTKGNCHFNEVKVENNVCAESGYVYSLITNEGSFMYEVGEFIQNHAIAITTTPTGTSQVVGSFHNYLDPADQSGGSAIFLYGTMHVFKYSHIQDAIYLEQSNNVRGRLLISNSLESQLTIVCQKPQEGWVVAQATDNYKLTQADLQKLVLSSALAKEYKLELVDNTIVLKALTGTQYNVTVEACKNGTLTADKKVAAKGEVVTITAKPAKGYKLYTEQLCYNRYYQLQQLTGQVNVFTFNMPSTHAHVEAEFIPEKVNIIYPDPDPFDPNKDILPGKGFGNLDSLINFVNTPDEIGQEAKPVPDDELPGDLRGEIDNAKEKGDKHYGSLEDLIAFVSGTQKTVLYSTPCKVRLTFYLPKSSLRASTNGSYYILCESEGKVTQINPEYDAENNALMFETDKLGIFAVMYGNSSTANDDITRSVHVWSEGNTLHVFTAEQATVRIYTLGGQLYKTATGYGELQFTGIPNGNYIIEVKNRTFKIAL